MTAKHAQQVLSVLVLVTLLAGALPVQATPFQARLETTGATANSNTASSSRSSPGFDPASFQPSTLQGSCYATDLDCDRDVDGADVSVVAAHWNCASADPCYDPASDLDNSGAVDAFDLAWVGNDFDVTPPVITIDTPAEGQVVSTSTILVSGSVSDAHAVASVTVNGIPATLNGSGFSATVSLPAGNQVLDLAAEDALGQVGLTSRLVRVDASGPEIEIHAPKPRQAVYTQTPAVDIRYSDFYGDVQPASLVVRIIDGGGGSTDVTGDLLVTAGGASGTLSTPLAADASYTMTVSLSDGYGNLGSASAAFYVPPDPSSITPPEEPVAAGWVSGVIYDSSTCNEHLTTCQGLAGAGVTLEKVDTTALAAVRTARQAEIMARLEAVERGAAASFVPLSVSEVVTVTLPISGTVVTGPDGFFAFPVGETAHYWLRVEKQGYTYGQREAEVVRERSAATNAIYLTPVDPAVTACGAAGCSHTSSDGVLQVEIPPGAIAPGEVVATTATDFEHVEYLPSGSLPPGTWETYAFNLGGDSEYTFDQPITVRQANALGFAPGARIPLGYWNSHTQQWEHEGFGIVDASGLWVEMSLTHFSNYDINYVIPTNPVPIAEAEDESFEPDDSRKPDDPAKDDGCSPGSQACLIRYDSGTLEEEYTLPEVTILGGGVAPTLRYRSDRADSTVVIDIKLSVKPPPGAVLEDYLGFELYIEGIKTDSFTFEAQLSPGEVGRYRYLWDGRDSQGNRLPPGMYEYAVKLSVPYTTEYCVSPYFGGPPWCEVEPTGIGVTVTEDTWVFGSAKLDADPENPLGAGWALGGQQRLYEDEAGHILVTDGRRADEFYFAYKDLLSPAASYQNPLSPAAFQGPWVAWVNSGDDTMQFMKDDNARNWQNPELIAVGQRPTGIAVSPDGAFAYLTNNNDNTVSVVDLAARQQTATIGVGQGPWDITLSEDGATAYVTNTGDNTLSVIDLVAGQQTAAIAVGAGPYYSALSPDGATAYVTNIDDNTLSVVNLAAGQQTATIAVGQCPWGIVVSPDGAAAYVTNACDDTVSVVDLAAGQQTATIAVGQDPEGIVLSPDGATAYVTNYADGTISVVDLAGQQQTAAIAVGVGAENIALSPDGATAYVTFYNNQNFSVIDLAAGQQIATITLEDSLGDIALSPSGDFAYVVTTGYYHNGISVIELARAQHMATVAVGQEPHEITLSPDGAFAYVTNYDDDTISVVDLAARQQTATIAVGGYPQDIALSPDGATAYVTNSYDKTVSVVDLAARQQTATIAVGEDPFGIALSPDEGTFAYVTNNWDSTVSVVYLAAGQQVATIAAGWDPQDIAVSPDGAFAYVVNANYDVVSVLDLAARKHIATIPVGGMPEGIALSPDGAFAYVTNNWDNTISVVDLAARKQVATIDVGSRGRDPWGIAVSSDGAYAYVTNTNDGSVSVVDLAARQQVVTIPAGYEPLGIAVSPAFTAHIISRTSTDTSTLTYDPTTATYTRLYPNGTSIHFNPDGTHDYTLDPVGNKTGYSYNPDGTLASIQITAAGKSAPSWAWSFDYQGGKLASILDPAGRTTAFTVDRNGQLAAIASPDGAAQGYAYDAAGRLTQFSDENGAVTTYSYDRYGRISTVTEPPRAVYDPLTGQVEIGQEVREFTPSDTGYALINASPVGDPDNPAPAVPKSADLADGVQYGRGELSGHTNRWGYWLDQTDGLGRTTYYQRDAANNLTRTDHPDGACVEYTYDELGNVLTQARMGAAQCALPPADRDPAQVETRSFTYEERFNHIKTETDPLGRVTTYVYDYEEKAGDSGNLVRIEYPPVQDENGLVVTPTVTYSYNAWGQVTTETDRLGIVTARRYTQGTPAEAYGQPGALFTPGVTPVPGLLTQVIRDQGGLSQTTTYKDFDAAGNPQTVLGPGGGTGCCGAQSAGGDLTRYTYDAWNRVLTEENALGIVTRYEYDGRGNRVRRVQDYTADSLTGRNVVTEYAYDAGDLLTSERTAADGLVVETVNIYDINRKLAVQRDGLGHETVYRYDEADQLVSVTDPAGYETTTAYTPSGQVETVTDPEGSVTRYVYDAFGRLVTETLDFGRLNLSTHYSYDLNGNLLRSTDPAGAATCYEYDDLDRRIAEVRDCDGLKLRTTYAYNLNGSTVYATDPRGVVTCYEYDALGRATLTRQDDGGLNLELHSTYDAAGNLTQAIDERGVVTAYTYDSMNRLVQTCQDALGLNLCTRYTYDRLGRQETVTDPNGMTTHTQSNVFGLPVQVTQDQGGLNAVTAYSYDHALNLVRIVDANGHPTQYAYTPRDQVETETYADGTSVHMTYDGRGNVHVRTAQDGTTLTHTYDGAGRLAGKSFSGGSQTFAYDAAGRLVSAGQTANGHTSTLTYAYNPLGDVTGTTQVLDGLSWAVSYAYDYPAGKLTTTYPSGTQRVQEMDALGRLDAVRQGGGSLVADYAYNDLGGYSTVAYPNGVTARTDFDALRRTTRVSSGVADYRYGYDRASNVTSMQRWHQPGQPTDVYQYDGLYQLTQVWYGADAANPAAITSYDHLQWYDLDSLGNRLEVQNDHAPQVYLPNDGYKLTDPLNRYQQVGASAFSYDLRGDTLGDGVNSYNYDALNRQVGMSGPGGTAEYVYDAQGRRIARVIGGTTTFYIYDIQYRVLEERAGNNSLVARYTYGAGIDELLAMERGGITYYYLSDALGSVTEVTNAAGVLVERYEYDVYGGPRFFDGAGNPLSASAIGNPYLFTGRAYDPESGNYYFRARVYQPRLGRFLQVDPLGYRERYNLYLYARNNPLSRTDALGLFSLDLGLKGGSMSISGKICFPTGIPILRVCVSLELKASKFTCCDSQGELKEGSKIEGPVSVTLEPIFNGSRASLGYSAAVDIGRIKECPDSGWGGDVILRGGIGYSFEYGYIKIGGGCTITLNLITGSLEPECKTGIGSYLLGVRLSGVVKKVGYGEDSSGRLV